LNQVIFTEKNNKNKKNRGASPHTPPRMPGAFCLNAGLRATMTVQFAVNWKGLESGKL